VVARKRVLRKKKRARTSEEDSTKECRKSAAEGGMKTRGKKRQRLRTTRARKNKRGLPSRT
jgi:hypothetical protein